MTPMLGQLVHGFLVDHLSVQKGLRLATIRSYRDGLRLFLQFIAADARRKITRLALHDLTFDRVLRFLQHLEDERGNHTRTRNQRLAILHTFFDYLGSRVPEVLPVSQRVAAIPVKRAPPPETQYLDRDDVETVLKVASSRGALAPRDHALLLFLYNTGARVQEVADLRVANLDLGEPPRVRLHGKGDKWRICPLWKETAERILALLSTRADSSAPDCPVFFSQLGRPLTRFGIYKIVRRHTVGLEKTGERRHHISPHVFRHSTAVHLLESGVEVNVIRGWLGHVSIETTNHYAEISVKAKEAALRLCEPPSNSSEAFPRRPVWREDAKLLAWLDSL